jgi:hypothetical protein
MEKLAKNPEANFFMEKIRENLPELKHQLMLMNTMAFYCHTQKMKGKANDLQILPQDIRPEQIQLLYGLLHSMS